MHALRTASAHSDNHWTIIDGEEIVGDYNAPDSVTDAVAALGYWDTHIRPYEADDTAPPPPTRAEYAAAIQAHVDGAARARGYHDGFALAGYATSTIPAWAAEAAAFISWRDAVWVYAYTELAKVQNAERAQPSISELVGELPEITWPT